MANRTDFASKYSFAFESSSDDELDPKALLNQ
jgi:hypothetical protein